MSTVFSIRSAISVKKNPHERSQMIMEATWDMLQLTLRHGSHPRCVVTTTPRPSKLASSKYCPARK
jgi:phage terminase large subunit-like protein